MENPVRNSNIPFFIGLFFISMFIFSCNSTESTKYEDELEQDRYVKIGMKEKVPRLKLISKDITYDLFLPREPGKISALKFAEDDFMQTTNANAMFVPFELLEEGEMPRKLLDCLYPYDAMDELAYLLDEGGSDEESPLDWINYLFILKTDRYGDPHTTRRSKRTISGKFKAEVYVYDMYEDAFLGNFGISVSNNEPLSLENMELEETDEENMNSMTSEELEADLCEKIKLTVLDKMRRTDK